MHWYVDVLRKYATFDGRARRQEFWMFTLINFIIAGVLEIIRATTDSWVLHLVTGLYGLFVLIPTIAVTVRRLHDSNHRGWWWWIGFVPIIGWIWLLVLMCIDGTHGPNRSGPDPKTGSGYATAGVYGPA